MTTKIKISKWLLIVFTLVIVLGTSFTYWYTKGDKQTIDTKTSPTPIESIALSPSPGISISPSETSTIIITPTSATTPSDGKLSVAEILVLSYKYIIEERNTLANLENSEPVYREDLGYWIIEYRYITEEKSYRYCAVLINPDGSLYDISYRHD